MGRRWRGALCSAWLAGWTIALTAPAGSQAHPLSGGYLGKTPFAAVYWLQVVATPDQHVTGQFEALEIGKSAQMSEASFAVTGAVDGESVSLTLKSPIPLVPSLSLAGTFQGGVLTLTGLPGSSQLVLQRASVDAYTSEKHALDGQARQALALRAAGEKRHQEYVQNQVVLEDLTKLRANAQAYNAKQAEWTQKLGAAESRYSAITAKMQEYLLKEQALAGNASSNAYVARSQIVVRLNEGVNATTSHHLEADDARRSLQGRADELSKEFGIAGQRCRQIQGGAPVAPEQEAWKPVCADLHALQPIAEQNMRALGATLDHLETTYQQEKGKQAAILREGERIN